jgi:hypothetical protein
MNYEVHTVPWLQRRRQNRSMRSSPWIFRTVEGLIYLLALPCIWNSGSLCSKMCHFLFEWVTLILGEVIVVGFTALLVGDDVYSCSVAPVCDGIDQNECSAPLLPVLQSHLRSPAVMCHVSVWCLQESLWASPADCRRHTLALRTGL